MDECKPPFRFDFRDLLSSARRKLNSRVGGVTIKLPFMSLNVSADDIEQKVAREIVIRLADRRVLNASECCDGCIDNALTSLQEIRRTLVDTQVQLSRCTDGSLYLLVELMLSGIRQFLTFTERGNDSSNHDASLILATHIRRPREDREIYFAALEVLRAHLYRCLTQISRIGDVRIPRIADRMRYDDVWQIEAYEELDRLETPHESK